MDGYRLRSAAEGDLEAAADVLVADELDHDGEVTLDADFLREEWAGTDFDLSADAWVVTDGPGTIVGYAQITREEPGVVDSWGVVHPDHRGRGIGSRLLDRIEQRAAEVLAGAPSGRLRHGANADDRAAAAMLGARGLQTVRYFWHMQIDLDGSFEPGPPPEGIEIRGVEVPGDHSAVHAILQETFADHWGHHPKPFDRWSREQIASPSYDPSLWQLATDGARPVAALTASAWGDRGWIGDLGVVASHRGRGIGAALLRRSFAAFASRGLARVILNVDAENATGATALYERVGMRVVNRWSLWERMLWRT